MNELIPQNFEWTSGDDLPFEIEVTDQNDVAEDLTGASITWAMARRPTSSILLTKTVGSGITITDAVNGLFLVKLDAADGENFRGDYYHEAEVVFASGDKRTVARGTISVPVDLIT